MAMIIAQGDQAMKIARDDSDLANLNLKIGEGSNRSITITDQQFDDLVNGVKGIESISGETVTYFDKETEYNDQVQLDGDINIALEIVDQFLTGPNEDHADYSFWQSWKDQLKSVDTAGISYPLVQNWGAFCTAQGITTKITLQIP